MLNANQKISARKRKAQLICRLMLGTILMTPLPLKATADENEKPPNVLSTISLQNLQEDCLLTILSHLNYKGLAAFSQTSKMSHQRTQQLLTLLAEKGEAPAQYHEGIRSFEAWQKNSDEENKEAALNWFLKAATQGNHLSQQKLDMLLLNLGAELENLPSSFFPITHEKASEQFIIKKLPRLEAQIVELTGAKPDVLRRIHYVLTRVLFPKIQNNASLKRIWKDVWVNLKEPEDLILFKTLKKSIENNKNQGLCNKLTAEHEAFTKINHTINELIPYYEQEFSKINIDGPFTLSLAFQQLKYFYQSFRDQLLELVNSPSSYHEKTNKLTEAEELKATMLLPVSGFYKLAQDKAHHILKQNEHGDQKAREEDSNHQVERLPERDSGKEAEIYFKLNGHPDLKTWREFMATSLYKTLNIPVPNPSIVIIDNVKNQKGYSEQPYMLQASHAVSGVTAAGAQTEDVNWQDKLNKPHYNRQVIGALLTRPSDGKLNNFIYNLLPNQEYGLVSIDNDDTFEAVEQNGYLHLKSALFCLKKMDEEFDADVLAEIERWVPEKIILAWLERLQHQQTIYERFLQTLQFQTLHRKARVFDAKELEDFLKEFELPTISSPNGLVLDLKISLSQIQNIYETLQEIKKANNRFLTPNNLLKKLYPSGGAIYKTLRKKGLDHALAALYRIIDDEHTQVAPTNSPSTLEEVNPSPQLLWKHFIYKFHTNFPYLADEVITSHLSAAAENRFDVKAISQDLALLHRTGFSKLLNNKNAVELWIKGQGSLPTDKRLWNSVWQDFVRENPELTWLVSLEEIFPRTAPTHTLPQALEEVKGVNIKHRKLTQEIRDRLFDKDGCFKKDSTLKGRADVSFYPLTDPEIYLKAFPELPAHEYAAANFMRKWGIKKIPFSELMLFYHPREGLYPVLLSQAIKGKSVYKVWGNSRAFDNLDPHHTGLTILAAMLLNPEDGTETNHILTEDGKYLIPIDNDHTFLPGVLRTEGSLWKGYKVYEKLQTKTLLFCLPHMKRPLPETVIKQICSMNMDSFLQAWMTDLENINSRFQELLPKKIPTPKSWKEKGVDLRFFFKEAFIENLHAKAHLMQKLLKNHSNITPIELLKALEPYVGKKYETALIQKSSVQEAFDKTTEELYPQRDKEGVRISPANSRQLMEIWDVSPEEITDPTYVREESPLQALERLKDLSEKQKLTEKQLGLVLGGRGTLEAPLDGRKERERDQQEAINALLALPRTSLAIHDSRFFYESHIAKLSSAFQISLKALDLRGCKNMTENALRLIAFTCSNLEYINLSEWHTLKKVAFKFNIHRSKVFPALQRLVMKGCKNIQEVNLVLPALQFFEAKNAHSLKKLVLNSPKLSLCDLRGVNKLEVEGLKTNITGSDNLKLLGPWSKGLKMLYYKAKYANNPQAQFQVGTCYAEGTEVKYDWNKAKKWIIKAAQSSHRDARKWLSARKINYSQERKINGRVVISLGTNIQGFLDDFSLNSTFDMNRGYIRELLKNPDSTGAIEYLNEGASKGHAISQYYLGLSYAKRNQEKDIIQARYWLRQAALNGHSDAQYVLSNFYLEGFGCEKDYEKALPLLIQAAEQNNLEAQTLLMRIYEGQFESHIPSNFERAHYWATKAAEQGDIFALYNLTNQYFNGLKVEKNLQQSQKYATKLLKILNERGDQLSAEEKGILGFIYYVGYGVVERDLKKAFDYIYEAAREGNIWSQSNLSDLYKDGLGVEQDYFQALKWAQQADEGGEPFAGYLLATMHRDGEGMAHNDAQAFSLFKKAAENEEQNAQYALGLMYESGRGTPQNELEAQKWKEKALTRFPGHALYSLGRAYQFGLQVEKDFEKAISLYKKAVNNGSIDAQIMLEKLGVGL
jgi:TPR repeat protein